MDEAYSWAIVFSMSNPKLHVCILCKLKLVKLPCWPRAACLSSESDLAPPQGTNTQSFPLESPNAKRFIEGKCWHNPRTTLNAFCSPGRKRLQRSKLIALTLRVWTLGGPTILNLCRGCEIICPNHSIIPGFQKMLNRDNLLCRNLIKKPWAYNPK